MYVRVAQMADQQAVFFRDLGLQATWAIRTPSSPAPFVGSIQQALLRSTDLPAAHTRTMDEVVESVTAPTAMNMWMMTVFAVVAVVLAVVGLYAIAAYSVEQRRHELGIRLALGADPSRLRNGVITDSMRSVWIGTAIGVAFAAIFGSVLRSLVFGVRIHDPTTTWPFRCSCQWQHWLAHIFQDAELPRPIRSSRFGPNSPSEPVRETANAATHADYGGLRWRFGRYQRWVAWIATNRDGARQAGREHGQA